MAIDGTYNIVAKSMFGSNPGTITINTNGDNFSGSMSAMGMEVEIPEGKINGDSFEANIIADGPMGKAKMNIKGTVDGDKISGAFKMKVGGAKFSGTRA